MPANPNFSDLLTSTIDLRSGKTTDNITNNIPLLAWMREHGNIKTASGGNTIVEEVAWAQNQNAQWYNGGETLAISGQESISGAQFQWKQLAAAVTITGREMMINSGRSKMLDLLDERIGVAEATLDNVLDTALYSDGTGFGGRQLTGIDLAIPINPLTGSYGGIDRSVSTWWQSQIQSDAGAPTATTIQGRMNSLFQKCTRGKDKPDLIIMSQSYYSAFWSSLQAIQRITDPKKASLGFGGLDFAGATVLSGGGIGGNATDTLGTGYFINTKYFRLRPHERRNFVPLNPDSRYAIDQDALVKIIGWMGNLTSSSARLCGRMIHS